MVGTGFHKQPEFVPCTILDARSAINSLLQMVVVVHAFLFVQYFTMLKEHLSYFPTMIGMNNTSRNNNARSLKF